MIRPLIRRFFEGQRVYLSISLRCGALEFSRAPASLHGETSRLQMSCDKISGNLMQGKTAGEKTQAFEICNEVRDRDAFSAMDGSTNDAKSIFTFRTSQEACFKDWALNMSSLNIHQLASTEGPQQLFSPAIANTCRTLFKSCKTRGTRVNKKRTSTKTSKQSYAIHS